jgi:hypothetical protein
MSATFKNNITLSLLFAIFSSCNGQPDEFQKKILKESNPIEITLSFPDKKLKDTIVHMFEQLRYLDSPYYRKSVFVSNGKSDEEFYEISFTAETREKAVFAKNYFQDQDARDDIFLYNGYTWPSPVYSLNGTPVPFRSSYILSFKKTGTDETLLRIRAYEPVIILGTECCGPHGDYGREVPVESTTIEEHILLGFIAEQLGVKIPPPKTASNKLVTVKAKK